MQRSLFPRINTDNFGDNIERREIDADIPLEIVEEGSKLVEELLRTWSAKGAVHDDDDVVMADDDDDTPEAQLAELQKCVEEFRPRLEQNLWAQRILESFA